jgi:adenylyltransferase/sulfurtransferase
MTHVLLPLALRDYVAGRAEIDVRGDTVSAALGDLVERHPLLRRHLFDDNGELRGYVNVYLNDDEVRHLADGVSTTISADDRLMIVPSIAGG